MVYVPKTNRAGEQFNDEFNQATAKGVTQAEYDRLRQMMPQRQNADSLGRAQFNFDSATGGFELQQYPDPMDHYYVIQDPASTLSRRTVEIQTPANPGIRKVAVSTYGVTVPVSVGRRVITGNIIDANPITPRLVGGGTRVEIEREPIYPSGPS